MCAHLVGLSLSIIVMCSAMLKRTGLMQRYVWNNIINNMVFITYAVEQLSLENHLVIRSLHTLCRLIFQQDIQTAFFLSTQDCFIVDFHCQWKMLITCWKETLGTKYSQLHVHSHFLLLSLLHPPKHSISIFFTHSFIYFFNPYSPPSACLHSRRWESCFTPQHKSVQLHQRSHS